VNCKHFQAIIDGYLDGVLEPGERTTAWDHVSSCGTCNAVVTSYQQASALLKAAVTDKVAAVDVSGLWEAIERTIAIPDATDAQAMTPAFQIGARRAEIGWLGRLREWGHRLGTAGDRWALGPVRVGATLAVAVALGSLLWLSGGEEAGPERVARAKSKAVRIEALEVPSGYTVSTWARPRSRTRMIAINPTPGYAVASASFPSR
jgi:hypothetical protein